MADYLSLCNSVTIASGITDVELVQMYWEIGCLSGLTKRPILRPQKNLQSAVKSLWPVVKNASNRFVILTGSNQTLFIIGNSSSGSGVDLLAPVALSGNCEACYGFLNYPYLEKGIKDDIYNESEYSHFLLQVVANREIIRSIISIKPRSVKPQWANFGKLYKFENDQNYAELHKGKPPEKEVLWKFCNYYDWPSPGSAEFSNSVSKASLFVDPNITDNLENRLVESLQKSMMEDAMKNLTK